MKILGIQKHHSSSVCLLENDKIFVFLGSGIHKIKKKAEQIACEVALAQLNI